MPIGFEFAARYYAALISRNTIFTRLRKHVIIPLLLLFICSGFVRPASAAIAFVQVNSATPQSSPASVSVTYTGAQTAGNLNVIVVGWNNSTSTVSSVTDTKGNVYQLAVGPTAVTGSLSQSIYYAKNITSAAGSANAVTVQFSGATAFPDIRILEYSGADPTTPVDVTAAATGNSASSNSGTATTTSANDLIFGAGTTTTHYTGAGSGFTSRIITTQDGDIAEDRLVTATGSYSAVAPLASGAWVMQMVAFRAAGSGSSDTTPPTAPSSLTATANGSSQVNLSWTASTDNVAVTNYLIERCITSSCTFAQIGTSTTTTYGDSGLTANTGFSYRVRATDAAANLSAYSNTATATTAGAGATGPPVFVAEAHTATEGVSSTNDTTTFTLNVSGPNALLVVAWHAEFDGTLTNSWSTTDNGVQGTQLVSTDGYNGGTGNQRFRIYYWLNPPAGTNTITVFTPYTGANELAVSAVLFNNVSQTNPFGTPVIDVNPSARTGESETVTSSTTDLILHVIADAIEVPGTLGTGETSLSYANDGKHAPLGDASLWLTGKPGASPTTTVSSSGWNSQVISGVGIPIHGTIAAGPTNLAATAVSSSQINLSWTAPTGNFAVANYLVERCQGTNCTAFTQVGTVPVGTTTSSDSGLSAATPYSYRVRATDGTNFTAYSNTASATTAAVVDTQPPTAPSNLTATAASSSQINLSWTAATDNVGVTGYLIEQCVTSSCTFAQIGTSTGTTFSATGLTASTNYSYRVRATDATPNLGPYSNTASATTSAAADTQAPTAPSNLTATSFQNVAVGYGAQLNWTASTDNVGVTQYLIERCQGASCTNFVQISTSTTNAASDPVNNSLAYRYRVRATDAANNLSSYSNIVSFTFVDTIAPTTPSNLGATVVSASQINLTWTGSTDLVGVSGYLIERCLTLNCTFAQVGTTTGIAATSFNDTGLTPSTSYTYRVRATDAANNLSGYSNTAVAGTQADTQPPTTPTNLIATSGWSNGPAGQLNWTASTDNVAVAQYLIERCQGASCTSFAQIGTSTSPSFVDLGAGLVSNSYRVRAADTAGNLSGYSNVSTFTWSDTTPPTAPSNLTATAASSTQINLSWTAATDNTQISNYLIERCLTSSCTFAQVGTATATTFSDTGLTAQTGYSYRVRATDFGSNLGPYSNTASATTPSAIPAGLVAAYAFNEGSGTTVTDLSGNNLTGTIQGATWTTSGKYGNALSFNGTSSYVDLGNPTQLQLTGSMTIEAWVNAAANPPDDGQIVAKSNNSNGWQFKTSPDTGPETFGVAVSGTTSTRTQRYSTTVRALNTWYHVAGVYDATNKTLSTYVNGVLSNGSLVGTIPASQFNSTVNVNIGRRTTGYYFNGIIDEVRIYNRALSVAEIQGDMNTPLGVAAPPDTTPPTAPSSLTATAVSTSQINLSWTASTDNVGVTSYLVERCTGTCTTYTQIAAPTTTTFSDTGLATATTYGYRVRAIDAAGNLSSYSNAVTATTQSGADTQAPTAPTNLAATAVSATQINLTWTAATDNVGVTNYLVEQCITSSCTFSQIGTTASTSFSSTSLAAGTGYSYRVRATDAAGNLGSYSNTASATTTAADTQAPTTPTNLVATTVSGSQINLTWTGSTDNVGVTGYLIERCTGVGCSSFDRQNTVPGTTYSDTGLVPNTSYTYQVKATDAAGNFSAYSNQSTTTTSGTVSGLIAAYTFDEGTGTTLNDFTGGGHNGTIANGTWTNSGKYGKALVFNGTSTIVTIPDAAVLHLTTGMTLEAWVNPSQQLSGWDDVVYKGNDNYGLEASSSPIATPAAGGTFGSSDTFITAPAPLTPATWTHLAATFDGSTLRLYVNGTLVNSSAQTAPLLTSTNPLQIGGDSIFGQFFQGTIDEVRVYNTALNQSQIQADMALPVSTGSIPVISLGSSSVTFAGQQTGTTSAPTPVTVTNTGTASLTITSVGISGGNTADFNQTNNCVTTLAPAASCTINITFTPATTGTRTSSVSISDNAVGSPHSISLSGTGTGFQINPRVVALTFSRTQVFTPSSGTVNWTVDGVAGGNATVGTITTGGLYTPPASVGSHTVTGTVVGQSTAASSTVYVTNTAGIFTHHNDNMRSGVNSNETVLTQGNVNQTQFGKLFSYSLDGVSYSSPLYVANVNIPNQGFHNMVYVATEHDTLYAFDADGLSSTPIWQKSFLGTGITTVPCADVGECGDIQTEIGITGTPVIDQSTNTIYLVVKTKESGNDFQRLHALDITTGAEKFNGPVVISGSVPGTGNGSAGGVMPFDPLKENQRPGLALVNGVIYITWSSHGDQAPWHGWVMGYNATTLAQTMIFCATPDANGGGIWQSGLAPAADASNNIYFTTANGNFNANTGGKNYGDTVVKLNASGSVVDYFTPFDQSTMDSGNLDLSSAGPALLVDQPGATPHLMVTAAKGGTIYVVNRDNMGHFNSGSDSQIYQSIPNAVAHGGAEQGNYSSPVFFNNRIYYAAINDNLKTWQLTNGFFTTTPTSQSAVTYPTRGGAFSVSANGTSNGILWAIQDNNPSNGVLRAYDPNNLATEFYNSTQAGTRDSFGVATKFAHPVVINGKVYVMSQGQLVVYGLLP